MAALRYVESPSFAELLCDHVDSVDTFQSLVPVIEGIGIDIEEIRNMIKNKIGALNDAAARKVAFNVMPIDTFLPMDTLQHILSFNHISDVQQVSKSFKMCFDRNERIINRARQEIVAHCFVPDVPFDCLQNRIALVGSDGQGLAEIAAVTGSVAGGFILHDDLEQCLNDQSMKSGDMILLQKGFYEINNVVKIEDKNLRIIGMEEGVEIHFHGYRKSGFAMAICGDSKVFIQNIIIQCVATNHYTTIHVRDQSILWMETCGLFGGISCVNVDDNASAHFKSCTFGGVDAGINVDSTSAVEDAPIMNVLSCKFLRHNRCITTNAPVRSVGNEFTTNGDEDTIVVATEEEGRFDRFERLSVFQGTVFLEDSPDLYEICGD